jgi:predicted RNase H-like HicB family nuclease
LGLSLGLFGDLTRPMKAIKVIIEKTKDMYTAYAENIQGIYSGGDTIEEAKASIQTSIKLYNKYNKLDPEEYSITYEIKPE